jgi:hypothetical protein
MSGAAVKLHGLCFSSTRAGATTDDAIPDNLNQFDPLVNIEQVCQGKFVLRNS